MKRALALMIVVAGAAAVWFGLSRRSNEGAPVATHESSPEAVAKVARPVLEPKVETGAKAQGLQNAKTLAKLSDESHARLLEIARLDRKALLSDDDKAYRAKAFEDARFLNEIANVLASQDMSEKTKRDQYQAIDTLLDAQASGSKEAEKLLASVVSDAQVESESLAKDVRENLAGIKAEVLYKWSAQDRAASIEPLLPGPVSRKLWTNVQEAQARNEAESRTLSH